MLKISRTICIKAHFCRVEGPLKSMWTELKERWWHLQLACLLRSWLPVWSNRTKPDDKLYLWKHRVGRAEDSKRQASSQVKLLGCLGSKLYSPIRWSFVTSSCQTFLSCVPLLQQALAQQIHALLWPIASTTYCLIRSTASSKGQSCTTSGARGSGAHGLSKWSGLGGPIKPMSQAKWTCGHVWACNIKPGVG